MSWKSFLTYGNWLFVDENLKSPLRYVLARSLSFHDPRKMFSANEFAKRVKQFLRVLVQVGYLKEDETDKSKHQYTEFIHLCGCKTKFQDFNIHEHRVNESLSEKNATQCFLVWGL